MRLRDVGEGRRAFLARLLMGGGVSLAGCARCAKPAKPPVQRAPAGPFDVEILEEPIVLRSGESLVDRSFALSAGFAAAPNAVIVVAANGVTVRNVRILGSARWTPGKTVGLRIEAVRDVTVEQVSIEGLPGAGVSGHGIEGGLLRDVSIRHCYRGVELRRDAASRALRLERIRVGDLWGPAEADGRPADASLERPGGWIGGEGFALHRLRDCVVVGCSATGEMNAGFALTNPRRVRVQGVRGATLEIRGTEGRERGSGEEPVREVVVEDCFLDKGLGRGASSFERSCVQLSQNVESVELRDCVLNGAGQNGHAIQMRSNVHGRIVGCMIRGFNGMHGADPAHAIELAGGSTVNDDFERVNRLIEQQRARLDRNPAPR